MNKTLVAFSVLAIALILLGINRGFDISDEGVYALLAVPQQENIAGVFNYDLFFKLLYQFTGIEFGLVGLRVLRLLVYLGSAFCLSIVWKNITKRKGIDSTIFLLAFLAVCAGYGFLPASLSYNSLSVLLAALLLAALSSSKPKYYHFLVIGFALAFLVYVKITVFISLGILTLLYLWYQQSLKASRLLFLILPFVALELLLFTVLDESALSRIIGSYAQIQSREAYQIHLLLKYSLVGVFWVGLAGLPFYLIHRFTVWQSMVGKILFSVAVLALFCIGFVTTIAEEWNHLVLLLTAAFIAWQLSALIKRQLSQQEKLWLGIFLLMPFLLHFGSNVYWLRLGIHYWIFWILAVCYIFFLLEMQMPQLIYSGIACASTVLILYGIWIAPFEQESLWKADTKWEYKAGKHILLSEAQVEMLKQLEVYGRQNSSILTFYRIPGLAYLLGKNIPKSPGYWDKNQLEYYFPDGIKYPVLFYHNYDSLPNGFIPSTYQKGLIANPLGLQLQVLWSE